MSQVKFNTASGHQVMAGWDVPLDGFFLTIFHPDPDNDEPYYSSMDDPRAGHMGFMPTTNYFRNVLAKLAEAPEGFWERVERKEGNVDYFFRDGKWS